VVLSTTTAPAPGVPGRRGKRADRSVRLRVRAKTAAGVAVVGWVQAKNLRAKAPDEAVYPFRELDI
jgi:hypothetical protein